MLDAPSVINVNRLDMGALPMIRSMARTGLQVDLDHFAKLDRTLTDDMEEITEEVRKVAGRHVNLDSGDQVAELLFKNPRIVGPDGKPLKQARLRLTKSGDRESVDGEVLNAIKHDHPVIPRIQLFKELSKLRGTYVRPMPELARRVAFGVWRLFPNYRTTRVGSGRLSAYDPNLLAMPTRSKRGKDVRRGFITDEGWCYVTIDESQIEPRIATHRSKDPGLIKVYENDEDIYSDFAIKANQLPDLRYYDEAAHKWIYPGVDKDEHRFPAKTCILASFYAVTGAGLQEQMPVVCTKCKKESNVCKCSRFVSHWTENRCTDLINKFDMTYSGIPIMRKMDHTRVKRYGAVWCMWGRFIHVAGIKSVHTHVQSEALRQAGNHPMQAGSQGTIKLVMASTMDILESCKMLDVVHPLLQVHDELIFECRKDVAQEWAETVSYEFQTCCKLIIPIKAGWAQADNWGDLEK